MLNDHIVRTKGVHGIVDTSVLESNLNKGQANGYAGLDVNGIVPASNLPAVNPKLEVTTNKNIPNGYAGLDNNADIVLAQLPCGLIQKRVTHEIVGPFSYQSLAYTITYSPIANFNKRLSTSNLIVSIQYSGFLAGGSNPGLVTVGVTTAGVGSVTPVVQFYFNSPLTHQSFTGTVDLGKVSAGTFNVQAFIKVSSGITFSLDANDQFSMTAEEVLNFGG